MVYMRARVGEALRRAVRRTRFKALGTCLLVTLACLVIALFSTQAAGEQWGEPGGWKPLLGTLPFLLSLPPLIWLPPALARRRERSGIEELDGYFRAEFRSERASGAPRPWASGRITRMN